MSIAELSCAELTALYRSGQLSPVEAARDVLARIAANARFNAFMPIDPGPVLAAAAESEARWRQGNPLGPIDGVPATVKDNIWLKGYPTRRGSRTTDDIPGSRGFARARAAARAGRGFRRQDLFAGARLDRRLSFAAHRHHTQSLESGHNAGRLDRRRGGGGAAWASASCISAPTAPAPCAFRRPLPASSA